MKLHPIQHDLPGTLWCGPAALSACCGVPTSAIHAAIKSIRGGDSRRPVRGVSNDTLRKTAEKFGFRFVSIWDRRVQRPDGGLRERHMPTLAAFTKDFSVYLKVPTIINVTHHYVVVHGRTFVDNQTKQPVGLRKAPHRRRRVRRAWQVVPIGKLPSTQTVLTARTT